MSDIARTRIGNRRGRLGSESGLTLLEVLVALAILTIGIAGVLHAFSSSMASAAAAESYSNAAILANQVASELDRQDPLEAETLTGTFEDAPGYKWEAVVQPEDANGLMRAIITVSWKVGKNWKSFDMVVCLRRNQETTDQQGDGGLSRAQSQPGGG